MKLTGNTIFVTGGGSGIGRGLAETLHRLGNQVIISGRRKGHLAETTKANPGMKSVELDVENPASINAVTKELIEDYPKLNVLINNAGVMHVDNAAGAVDEALLVSTITTNLMGPIRLTGALIEHLKKQDHAAVMNVSSVLGFVPLAMAAVYSSTKAAIHSYTLSLRYPTQKQLGGGFGDCAALGADGPVKQQQRAACHAPRGIHLRNDRSHEDRRTGGVGGASKTPAEQCRTK